MLKNTLIELLSISSETNSEKKISLFLQKKLQNLQKFKLIKKNFTLCYFSQNFDTTRSSIAFYGHLDTVKNQQTIAVQEKNGFLYGCGASDMKAGIATMVELMKIIEQIKNLPYNYQFIFYTGEEGSYHKSGLEGIFEEIPKLKTATMAFVLEPTNNNIQTGCLGSIRAQVSILGKCGHSARPWLGENAIHKSWEFLKFLKETKPQTVTLHSLDFYEILSATMVEGGTLPNVIPDKIKFIINYRYAPNKTKQKAQTMLTQILKNKVDDIDILENAPSGKVVDNAMLKQIAKAFALNIEPKQAWTDIARLGLVGIDAVNLGSGNPNEAHQKNEKVSVTQLHQGLQIYKYIVLG